MMQGWICIIQTNLVTIQQMLMVLIYMHGEVETQRETHSKACLHGDLELIPNHY